MHLSVTRALLNGQTKHRAVAVARQRGGGALRLRRPEERTTQGTTTQAAARCNEAAKHRERAAACVESGPVSRERERGLSCILMSSPCRFVAEATVERYTQCNE